MRHSIRGLLLLLGLAACLGPPPSPAPRPDSGAAAAAAEWKPVSFAILEDYDKDLDLVEVARDFGMYRDLGITTWRGSFGWDDYEPAPGVYDFDWLHQFVRLARDSGITLRPYLGYTAEWAAAGRRADGQTWNDPPRDTAAWGRFVDTLVSALAPYGNVASWEIYNEENVPLWWDGTVAEYNAVLTAAAARIRRRHPAAEVLLGGTVWPDSDWLEATCDLHGNAGAFDVAPFHAYPETWPDSLRVEDYLDEGYRRWYLAAVDTACGGKPVWINEAGFATTPGKTEAQQASWWARAFATFLAAPRVEHIGVYEIKDLPPHADVIGEPPNYHLGLSRTDRTPKLAYHTVRMLARLFRGDSLVVEDSLLQVSAAAGVRLERHLFRMADQRRLLFVWSRGGEADVRIRLPEAGARAVRWHLDGTSRPEPLRDAVLEMTIGADEIVMVEVYPTPLPR